MRHLICKCQWAIEISRNWVKIAKFCKCIAFYCEINFVFYRRHHKLKHTQNFQSKLQSVKYFNFVGVRERKCYENCDILIAQLIYWSLATIQFRFHHRYLIGSIKHELVADENSSRYQISLIVFGVKLVEIIFISCFQVRWFSTKDLNGREIETFSFDVL